MATSTQLAATCNFCPHPVHPGERCPVCKCKGKRGWFRQMLDSIGNAVGEAKFGVLMLLLCSAAFAQLPDAPTPQPTTWEQAHGKPAQFFTFRSKWQDPPLRSNKQVFKSPTFLISQSAMILSMVVACRNPRSGETWGSEAPAVAGVFALDYLGARFFSMPYALGPAAYATVHYSRAATR